MSLNVGGIYVEAKKGVTRAKVVAEIRAYWTKLGARPYAGDVLAIEPLSLEKTGILGFAVSKDEDGWIAVYDSERYRADPALARQLSIALGAPVLHYELGGATDSAYAKVWGDGGPELSKRPKWDEVEELVGPMPWAFLYFNKLREAPKKDRADLEIFAFEGIPARPKAQYTGPTAEVLGEEAQKAEAERLCKANDIEGMRALLKKAPHTKSVIRDRVKYAKQSDPDALAFVLAFAHLCAKDPWTNREVAEAAARAGDHALFAKAFESAKDESTFVLWEGTAIELYKEKKIDAALEILASVIERPTAGLGAWNNWLAILLQQPLPPRSKIASRLEKAEVLAPKNPSMFHNLACIEHKLGDTARALEHIRSAVRCGYDNLNALHADDSFDDIRGQARFEEAFVPSGDFELDQLALEIIVQKKKRLVLSPVFGMAFFSKAPVAKIGPNIASAVERYVAITPGLTHYKSGWWKPISKGYVTKQLNLLRKPKKGTDYFELSLRAGDGDASERAVLAERWSGPTRVVMMFPRTIDAEEAFARFVEMAELLRFDAGIAGYTMSERDDCNVYEGVSWESEPAYARCLGFAPTTQLGPHWLTFLSSSRAKKVGELGAATKHATESGVVIRASAVPPIGVATNPKDVGAMPDVARALAQLYDEPDERWTAKTIASTPWDNRSILRS